jgi:transposase
MEKKMEILEAYDLTKSYRTAAEIAGCDPKTVAATVANRDAGRDLVGGTRVSIADAFTGKIEELVKRSSGKVRADVVHDRLVAMGYRGSERTTRRAVSAAKRKYSAEHHRIYKPWITEPGMWLQWDYGKGPLVEGTQVVLFCAWLAWSRYRFVTPLHDRSMASVIAALDACFRYLGGAPTYCLTDNEKTVTDHHIAGIAVRNTQVLSAGAYYGITIATCVPADPESKGGSESTVKLAKADIVPTDHNLIENYASWVDLVAACQAFCETVNTRVHREIATTPAERFAIEKSHLHCIPDEPYTATFGETRSVSWSATIHHKGARYSVPHKLAGETVWVRVEGSHLVIVATAVTGPIEVARHVRVGPGQISIDDAHYPGRRTGPSRQPIATNATEAAFLGIGEGANRWLVEAAASGVRKIETKMAAAVDLAALFGRDAIDRALGEAALVGRFADGDLLELMNVDSTPVIYAPEAHSLQNGTSVWSKIGVQQ